MPVSTQTPVRVQRDKTVRIKIIDDCGLACTFCHNEGTPVTADNKGRSLLLFVPGSGRTGRVSIYAATNGVQFLAAKMLPDMQPTLHDEVPAPVSCATSMGLAVGMTSNGERGRQVMQQCSDSGLDRVNVSVNIVVPACITSTAW